MIWSVELCPLLMRFTSQARLSDLRVNIVLDVATLGDCDVLIRDVPAAQTHVAASQ